MFKKITINIKEIADAAQANVEDAQRLVELELSRLVLSTHAFIIQKANSELFGFQRTAFLGPNGENVRWKRVSENQWEISLSSKSFWIEFGREKTFMWWLLTRNPKAKTAKDGSKYAHIPFRYSVSSLTAKKTQTSEFASALKDLLKETREPLRKIHLTPENTPKFGFIKTLNASQDFFQKYPQFTSKPRPPETAKILNLRPHSGISFLKGISIYQRPSFSKPGSVLKELISFRTISSKHEAEGRWFYPEVKPFNSFQAAFEYASSQVPKIVESIIQSLKRKNI